MVLIIKHDHIYSNSKIHRDLYDGCITLNACDNNPRKQIIIDISILLVRRLRFNILFRRSVQCQSYRKDPRTESFVSSVFSVTRTRDREKKREDCKGTSIMYVTTGIHGPSTTSLAISSSYKA